MSTKARNRLPIAEINVVPYIDVMLVLLVIFMITAPMLSQGVAVELPKAPSDNIVEEGREPIIVSVDTKGLYYLNVNNKPEQSLTAKDLVLKVAAELQLAREERMQPKVLVKGDHAVSYGKVVYAMGLLKQAGADKVGLVTMEVEEQ